MSDKTYIPFHRPSIGTDEIEAVKAVLESRWLTTGPVTLDFERQFAAYVGAKHALAVNSGTAALQLAVEAIGLKPGDEVIVPTYTFTASAEVLTYFGARPVLCDVVKDGFNLDPVDVERHISERTRAIIPVHIAGQVCDLAAIMDLANRYKLSVIDDAAHALPARWNGRRIGGISELTAFSFYATKTLTTGEGGMITTNNDDYAQRIRKMRLHGIGTEAWKRYSREGSWYYEVEEAGYKLNMTDVAAAIGKVQLGRCNELWSRRKAIASAYTAAFNEVEELEGPPEAAADDQHAWHLYILRIRPELLTFGRDELVQALKGDEIGCSVHFIPLHLHPYYQRVYGYKSGDFPNAEDAYSRCLSLPLYPDMTEAEVARVINSIVNAVRGHRRSVFVGMSKAVAR